MYHRSNHWEMSNCLGGEVNTKTPLLEAMLLVLEAAPSLHVAQCTDPL